MLGREEVMLKDAYRFKAAIVIGDFRPRDRLPPVSILTFCGDTAQEALERARKHITKNMPTWRHVEQDLWTSSEGFASITTHIRDLE